LSNTDQSFHERILSGTAQSPSAKLLRAALAIIEPAYATVMRARNVAYDRHWKAIHLLPRPTIAVGNLTTGGTGKTPVVRWLAEQFIRRNFTPAILTRGYRSQSTGGSDEQKMLQSYLGDKAVIVANPDRRAGAQQAMQQNPKPDLFLLDDAFQHRGIHRDFNLLLINATNPFGYNHVLPRGLLREPLSGINRADAILLTKTNQLPELEIQNLDSKIRTLAPEIPLYHSSHTITHLTPESSPALNRPFLFSGIANPQSFYAHFPTAVGTHSFADHHAYTPADLQTIDQLARANNASHLITTEKDFVKLQFLPDRNQLLPLHRAQLQITFADGDETRLLAQIIASLKLAAPAASPGPSAPASST
jgi:tetraacyldisaccharide 4'-kinase